MRTAHAQQLQAGVHADGGEKRHHEDITDGGVKYHTDILTMQDQNDDREDNAANYCRWNIDPLQKGNTTGDGMAQHYTEGSKPKQMERGKLYFSHDTLFNHRHCRTIFVRGGS